MTRFHSLAAGLAAVAWVVFAATASTALAAPKPGQLGVQPGGNLVEQAQFGRCVRWNRRCRRRWGGGPDYRRCMRRHGCRRGGRCARWRVVCGERWGWRNWRWRRCLRRHAC